MQTSIGRSDHPHDTFAFEERSFLGRLLDRMRGVQVEYELPRVGEEDQEPRPMVVEAAATAAKTIAIVATVILAGALTIVAVLFGFAGVVSLLTG